MKEQLTEYYKDVVGDIHIRIVDGHLFNIKDVIYDNEKQEYVFFYVITDSKIYMLSVWNNFLMTTVINRLTQYCVLVPLRVEISVI